MAGSKSQSKKAMVEVKYHCRDCANSYDWQSRALDGHLILCRCPYKKQNGKYLIFLSTPQCENFKLREDNGKKNR